MSNKVKITVKADDIIGKLPHNWNYVGYDECNYTHMPRGMELIEKFGKLEKPYYMRAHHMLCTGIMHGFYKWGSTNVYTEDENGDPVYYFDCIDKMVDIWLENNCKPFFELGFMPRDLADPRESENGKGYQMNYGITEYQKVGWALPPKDYNKWYDLIFELISHLKEKYGEEELKGWYFEMWNEPDIFYWHGTNEEYFKLYDYTEAALHKAMPSLRFGGPATCGSTNPNGNASNFLRDFLNHCKCGINYCSGKTGTRIDFTSFHTKGGGYNFDLLSQKQIPSIKRLVKNVENGCNIIKECGYGDLECILSEADPDGWAAGGRFDNFNLNFRNTEYYATYTMSGFKNIQDLADRMNVDVRPLTWAFEFEGERCFEGTRTFTTQGINKAEFNLMKALSHLDNDRISFLSSQDFDPLNYEGWNGDSELPEIDGYATISDDKNEINVLIYSHHDDWDISDTSDIEFEIFGIPFNDAVINKYVIDNNHSNAYKTWQEMGSPDWPGDDQIKILKDAADFKPTEVINDYKINNSSYMSEFKFNTHAITLFTIKKA